MNSPITLWRAVEGWTAVCLSPSVTWKAAEQWDGTVATLSLAWGATESWKAEARSIPPAWNSAESWLTSTSAPIPAPTLLSPADGENINPNLTSLVLDWDNSQPADNFLVQIDNNPDFSSPENEVWVTQSQYSPTLQDNLWYWRVMQFRSGENSGWSESRSFRVDTLAPDWPTMTSPIPGENLNDTTPILSWEAPAENSYPLAYTVEVYRNATFTDLVDTRTTSSTSLEWTPDLSDNLYYWRVRARDNAGNERPWTGFPYRNFRVDTVAPPKVSLGTPTPAGYADSTPSFEWARVQDNSLVHYRVLVSDSADFSTTLRDSGWITDNSWEVPSPQALAYGTYYWLVEVRDNAGNVGENSDNRYFLVDDSPPDQVSLTQPDNNSDQPLGVTFGWLKPGDNPAAPYASGVSHYWIQLDNEPGFDSSYFVYENTDVTENTLAYIFSNPGTYYWRVRAVDNVGNAGTWSDNFKLVVHAPPTAPVLQSPDNASQTDNTPTFQWTPGAYADNHRIEIDNDPDFSSPLDNVTLGPTASSWTKPSPGYPDGTYYWRVWALSPWGENCSENEWQFTVVSGILPGAPVLSSPENQAEVSDRPTFSWTPGSNADNHRLEVDNDPDFSSPIDNVTLGPTASSWSKPAPGYPWGTYYWRVWAVNANGETCSDNEWQFTVVPTWHAFEGWSAPLNGPDFSVSVSPASASVPQGESTTATVSIQPSGGFNNPVSLSASGQPSGVTVSFDPTSINPSSTSTMTVSVDSSVQTGTYDITVTGTWSSITRTTTFTLTVTPATDFEISVSPTSASTTPGGSASATVSVSALNGYSQTVSLSASGQPSGVTVSFDPASGTPSFPSTLSISVGSDVSPGDYGITITGTGADGKTHWTTFTLTVTSAGGAPPPSPSTEVIPPASQLNPIDPYWQTSTSITLTASASGTVDSVVLYYRYSPDNENWGAWAAISVDNSSPWAWIFLAGDGDGYYEFYSRARGGGLTESAPDNADTRCGLDTSDPVITSLLVNEGAAFTSSLDVTLTLEATDNTSGVGWVQLSSDLRSWTDWQSYSPQLSFTLPSGDGLKTVYARVRDLAGNVSEPASDTIELRTETGILYIPAAEENENYPLEFSTFGFYTEQVTVRLAQHVENRWVRIRERSAAQGPPENVQELPGRALLYFEVTTDLSPAEIQGVSIEVRVPRLWLESDSDRGRVRVYHWENSGWSELPTSFSREDMANLYFSAQVSGLSTFAVGLKPAPAGIPAGLYALLLVTLASLGVLGAQRAWKRLRRPRAVPVELRKVPRRRRKREEAEAPIVEAYQQILAPVAERMRAEEVEHARPEKPLREEKPVEHGGAAKPLKKQPGRKKRGAQPR